MAEAEGLICPVCMAAYGSVDKLQSHFDSAHAEGFGYAMPLTIPCPPQRVLQRNPPAGRRAGFKALINDLTSVCGT